jgi:hypothetical protein
MVAVDAAGNTYVAGDSLGSGTGLDIVTIKFGLDGSQIWARRYNGPANLDDVAWNLALDSSGNVFVSGRAGITFQDTDYLTIKYDPSGNLLWSKRYNGPGNREDVPYSMVVDPSGNSYVTGYSYGGATNWDFATVKYDPAGNQLWASRYADPSEDTALSMAVDAEGAVYVAGRSWKGSTNGRYDCRLVKYDSNGSQLWTQTYNGPANWDDEATAMGLDSSGNVYIGGYSTGNGTGSDYTTIKYDPGGTRLWVARYDGPAHNSDAIGGVAVEPGGGVWVTGSSRATSTTSGFATIKYDTNGAQVWLARRDGAAGLGGGRSIALDGAGNAFVAGQDFINNSLDLAVVKYSAGGSETWLNRYDGPAHGEDFALSVALDAYGNAFVSGSSMGSGTARDLVAIKHALGAIATSIALPDVSGSVGQTVTLSASLTATGGPAMSGVPVSIKVDGADVPGSPATTDASGNANVSFTLVEGSVGQHALSASYGGDGGHLAYSASAKLYVAKADTSLTAEDTSGDAGGSISLKTKLLRSDGHPLAGKLVRFEVNGSAAGTGTTDAEGVASSSYTIASDSTAGEQSVNVYFDGDADYSASNAVAKISVRVGTSLSVFDANGKAGGNVSLRAQLRSGNAGVAGKSVRFSIDGQPAGSGLTDADGYAEAPHVITEASGVHALTAAFDGDAQHRSSVSDPGKLTINMTQTILNVSNIVTVRGKTIKLRATLKGAGVPLTGQMIAFKIDGASLGSAVTNSDGIAQLSHEVTESLGIHTICGEYAGDASKFLASSGAGTLTVNPISTWLGVSHIPAQQGETVELKAKLRAHDEQLVGRTISFRIDGEAVGEAVTDANGVATLPHEVTESLGTHVITASFAGDETYGPESESAELRVRVTTKIVADSIKAKGGLHAEFGARLIQMPEGAGVAGKKLHFYSDNVEIGSAITDAFGRAAIILKAPPSGQKLLITVKFEGDLQFRGVAGTGKVTGL